MACTFTLIGFTWIKLDPAAGAGLAATLETLLPFMSFHFQADPWDLLTLPSVAAAYLYGRHRTQGGRTCHVRPPISQKSKGTHMKTRSRLSLLLLLTLSCGSGTSEGTTVDTRDTLDVAPDLADTRDAPSVELPIPPADAEDVSPDVEARLDITPAWSATPRAAACPAQM